MEKSRVLKRRLTSSQIYLIERLLKAGPYCADELLMKNRKPFHYHTINSLKKIGILNGNLRLSEKFLKNNENLSLRNNL